jgi:hypothetical protein
MNAASMTICRTFTTSRHRGSTLPILLLCATLQACGGGGSSDAPAASNSSVNGAPTISGSPATSVAVGQAYSFTPSASDPEGGSLTFSITGKPAWASFDSATGRLSGTPTEGTFANISSRVSDGANAATLPSFGITVSATSSGVGNGAATISWTPPTNRDDGTVLSNLAGYKIYYGTDPSDLTSIISVSNPGIASYTVDGLTSGTYYFTITALDASGLESRFSNVASKTIS